MVGCGTETDPPNDSLGLVAISAAGTGDVQIVDVGTGDTTTLTSGDGPFGSLALSLDGSAVAYARGVLGVLDRQVFVADVRTGDTRTIFPSTGQFMPSFHWLRSGWLWYPFASGFAFQTALLGAGQTDARLIGGRDYAWPHESPDGSLITYPDCPEQVQGRCVNDLVVEGPDGSGRVVLASGAAISSSHFTPDGNHVVYAAQSEGELRLWAQPISGGAATDLGAVRSSALLEYDAMAGGSIFSPAGTEVLAFREAGLVAVSLDGSGDRPITPEFPTVAACNARGELLYELEVNTEVPPDDTPEFEYSSFIVDSQGATRPLRQADRSCRLSRVSASGDFVSYEWCGFAPIHGRDGSLVIETPGNFILGFDAAESGVVVANTSTTEVSYVSLDGATTRVLASFLHDPGNIEWPAFAYAP